MKTLVLIALFAAANSAFALDEKTCNKQLDAYVMGFNMTNSDRSKRAVEQVNEIRKNKPACEANQEVKDLVENQKIGLNH